MLDALREVVEFIRAVLLPVFTWLWLVAKLPYLIATLLVVWIARSIAAILRREK